MADRPQGKSGSPTRLKDSASRAETLPDALDKSIPRPGDVVGGRYRLIRQIGDGAMGQVFVAENTAIGVEVAVKVPRRDLIANLEFRRRFQVEAGAVAAIDHPNVARFIDLGLENPAFIVMEYIRGETLNLVIRREGRLSQTRALRIASRLCWGLDAAHAAGIIHRDLKPNNIMLSNTREAVEMPKLLDFGLAKLVRLTDAPLSRTGQVVGTPEYMAPEQVEGKEVDPRADVYGLGGVLYAMIVGESPFAGAEDDVATMYRQLYEPAPVPSAKVRGIHPLVDALLGRALAKRPEHRFPSMQAMATAIESVLVELGRAPTAPVASAGIRRSFVVLALATTAAVGLAVGAALMRARAPAAAEQGGALLIVTSSPAGATVEVDGKPWADSTPAAQRVGEGRHVVTVRGPNHDDVVREVTLAADERAALELALPPRSREVTIRTVPTGAHLYRDDRLVSASTPTTVSLQADEFYQLRVERTGFQPAVANLGPDDHEPVITLVMEAERDPVGAIMVDSPAHAEVWIDGVDSGHSTPTIAIRMPVGEHRVELRDSAGGRSQIATVTVQAGVTERLLLNLGGGTP